MRSLEKSVRAPGDINGQGRETQLKGKVFQTGKKMDRKIVMNHRKFKNNIEIYVYFNSILSFSLITKRKRKKI